MQKERLLKFDTMILRCIARRVDGEPIVTREWRVQWVKSSGRVGIVRSGEWRVEWVESSGRVGIVGRIKVAEAAPARARLCRPSQTDCQSLFQSLTTPRLGLALLYPQQAHPAGQTTQELGQHEVNCWFPVEVICVSKIKHTGRDILGDMLS